MSSVKKPASSGRKLIKHRDYETSGLALPSLADKSEQYNTAYKYSG